MAAVRYSVEHPLIYGAINVQGSVNLLDAARQVDSRGACWRARVVLRANTPVPFRRMRGGSASCAISSEQAGDGTFRAFVRTFVEDPMTCVRFFNVYGPHGRPDMMPWKWAFAIQNGEQVTLYNAGRLKRDWTYIDDIVAGFIAALDKPFAYEVINLGAGARWRTRGSCRFWRSCCIARRRSSRPPAGERAADHLCGYDQGEGVAGV